MPTQNNNNPNKKSEINANNNNLNIKTDSNNPNKCVNCSCFVGNFILLYTTFPCRYKWNLLSTVFLSANSLIHISKIGFQSKCVFLSPNPVFTVQNSRVDLPQITRPTLLFCLLFNIVGVDIKVGIVGVGIIGVGLNAPTPL
jgi:hypothetical protein